MLPDAVMQGMGWQPPPPDPSLAGGPLDAGPVLHPAVLQGLGIQPAPLPAPPGPILAPPPSAAAAPPDAGIPAPPPPSPGPAPGVQLPSTADRAPEAPVPPPDFHIAPPQAAAPPAPPSAARAAAPAPAKPQTVEQSMAANQAALGTATQEEKAASAASTQANLGLAHDALVAEQDYAAKEAELQKQAAAQRDQAMQAHLTAQHTVEARMKALDDYKIDQNKFWNDMGVGGKIGWFVGMALSGIGNAFAGKGNEPNQVIQMLQQRMQQSIVLQQDKRDQMEKGVGRAKDLMQEGDLYQAKRAADIAAAQADATKMLKIQVDLATAKAQDPLLRANGIAESGKLDRQLALDQTNATEKLANYNIAKQNTAIAGGHLALAQQQYKLDVAWKSWQQNREQQQLDLQAAKESLAERKAIGEKDIQLGVTAPVGDGKGGASVGMLTNKDGTVWHAGNPEIATKTQKMVAAAQTYNELAAKMIQGIKDHGGESSWIKSADFQNMRTSMESAVAELHDAYGITSFREPTMKFFEEMATGGTDPTSFIYNASTGLKASAQNLQSKVNKQLHAANYNGPDISFAPLEPSPATSQAEQDMTALKDNRTGGVIGNVSAALAAAGGDKETAARLSGLQPKLALVATLAQRVEGRGPDADDAAAMLVKVVSNPDIAEPVRAAAEKALADANAKRKAGSFAAADKSFPVIQPGPETGKVPDIIRRINTPPALHPTITPVQYPGQPPGS